MLVGRGVNRVKIGKNILRGILGPYRARGCPRGRGWGAAPAGLWAAWAVAPAVWKKFP